MTAAGTDIERRLREPHVLREYALLADGERGIVVGPLGEMTWMCFPGWHDDAIFSSLIGGRGVYAVTPHGRFVWGGYYERGTLIWRSRWVGADGIVESREALVMPARRDRAILLRRVIALAGDARVHVVLDPKAGFGAHALKGLARGDDGAWTGRSGDVRLTWTGARRARPEPDGSRGKQLAFDLELEEGEHHDLVLVLDCGEPGEPPPDPREAWIATEAAWRDRLPTLDPSVLERDVQHSFAVLTGLTAATGGMVAAATTSLPERAREGRNYDYRYVWLRDQCYTGQAAAKVGGETLLDDAVRFVRSRLLSDGANTKPAYTVDGDRVPDERRLDLPGYPGGTDVVGNKAGSQFQLDLFGEALLLLAAAIGLDRVDADDWRAAEIAADAIAKRWREPDAGVWELEPARWTHSRLIAAAGLRAFARCQQTGERSGELASLADKIVSTAAQEAVHPSGRWQRSPEDDRVDAALVMGAVRGAIPADDPRAVATTEAVERELTLDGHVYRYRIDERPLGEAEGAFTLCGLWMSLARQQQGDAVAATRWFERARAACGPPGLYSEEYDVQQGQLRGNLPQAFVHALIIECAADQYAREQEASSRA